MHNSSSTKLFLVMKIYYQYVFVSSSETTLHIIPNANLKRCLWKEIVFVAIYIKKLKILITFVMISPTYEYLITNIALSSVYKAG